MKIHVSKYANMQLFARLHIIVRLTLIENQQRRPTHSEAIKMPNDVARILLAVFLPRDAAMLARSWES